MKVQRLGTFSISSLVIGFGFLYIPMLILVIYSFNASRLVTVWAGFSTKWYVELFQDQQLLDAAWMSLKIAFLTACMSLVMGMLASLALVRLERFRGKMSFAGMVTAPLVMPEVITGLSLLLCRTEFLVASTSLTWGTTRTSLVHPPSWLTALPTNSMNTTPLTRAPQGTRRWPNGPVLTRCFRT